MRSASSLFSLGVVSLALFACSSTPSTATAVVRPQLVAVDPDDFLGTLVHCVPPSSEATGGSSGTPDADEPNAVRSYVATLFDVTPLADDSDAGVPDPGTPLASSPPTPCSQPVTFSYVVEGHRYVAEVDAYAKRPQDLTPISDGSRLLSNADGTRALPDFVATCGGYPPSPYVDPAAGSGGAGASSGADVGGTSGTGGSNATTAGATSGANAAGGRPPGVVSYASLTQTPHDCGAGLLPPASN